MEGVFARHCDSDHVEVAVVIEVGHYHLPKTAYGADGIDGKRRWDKSPVAVVAQQPTVLAWGEPEQVDIAIVVKVDNRRGAIIGNGQCVGDKGAVSAAP